MIDWDKWQEIFDSINRHRLRTILTAFGVAWGIFMLVILLGAGQGLQNGIAYQFEGDALNSLWIRPGTTSMPYNGLKEGRRMKLTNEDYNYLLEQFQEVEELSGKYFLRGNKPVTYKQENQSFSIQAMHPDGKVVEGLEMTQGRFFNKNDLSELRKVAVIGQHVKDQLFKEEDPIGKNIQVDGTNYMVVGTFFDKEGEWAMRRVYLPITTVQKVYSSFDRIDQLILAAGDLSLAEMDLLEETIKQSLSERKLYNPNDREAMRVFNMAKEYQSFMNLMLAIKGIMWIVGVFSIIAGVIGVSNIMLIIVKDRTKEIGIRKALGATPKSIVGMIFQESIFITSVAGYLGLGLGIGALALLRGVESEFFRQPEVNIWIAVLATVILVAAGAFAGFLPAMQAAKINPVTAMKND